MAVIYPDKILAIDVNGVPFTGDVISVGDDGNYSYDYSTLVAAEAAAISGTLILVYPGLYYNDRPWITKNVIFRGMGELPEDVEVYSNVASGAIFGANFDTGSVNEVIIENLTVDHGYFSSWNTAIAFRAGSASDRVYLNKIYLRNDPARAGQYPLDLAEGGGANYFEGEFYATNCTIEKGYSHTFRFRSGTSVISMTKMSYDATYFCYECTTSPSPHDYVETPTEDYGHEYGEYIVDIIDVGESENLSVNSYNIFQARINALEVYDLTGTHSGTIIMRGINSVWADDDYLYVGTTNSGIYRSTASGVLSNPLNQYKYDSDITNNEVVYLHGAGDYLAATTISGIDQFDTVSGTRIYSRESGLHKCYQTTSGTLYYFPFQIHESLVDYANDWSYYQLIEFPATNIDNAQVYVNFSVSFPFSHCEADGADLRFVSVETGLELSYYIESWPTPPAKVVVRVPNAATTSFFMLYGNPAATSRSSMEAYYFYDDFTTVDTSVWQVNERDSGYVTSNGEYITINDSNNNGTEIITKEKIPYGLFMEVRMRRGAGTLSQYDGTIGFCTDTANVSTKRGYVKIDPTQAGDETLHYLNAYDTNITGFKPISPDWKVWEGLWSPGYQRSYYDGETLERSSVNSVFETENYFFIHQNCTLSNPPMEVDWIRMTSLPAINANTSKEILMEGMKLYAVYNPASNWVSADYTYTEFLGDASLVNDIYVTEETSLYNNDNVIFLATDDGVHVIEERKGDEINSRVKRFYLQ